MTRTAPHLSVIVPTLDEESRIGRCLDDLLSLEGVDEVVVVDGGSQDSTLAIARSSPAVRVLTSCAGRGRQMNAGARTARGEVLLFLHADVRLPADAATWIRTALGDRDVVAGAFRTWTIADDGPRAWLGPLLHLADVRSRYTRLPYGDQAIFVRAAAFARVGGFPDVPILEDRELCRRLRRIGRVRTVPATVHVSGRRFLARPLVATVLTNVIPLLYDLGVSPHVLARLYTLSGRRASLSALWSSRSS